MASDVRHREFRFPVDVVWRRGRRTTAHVSGKSPLRIAAPPEFRGTDPDLWSPEDAFVAAAGSCLAVTIAGLAAREELPLHELSVKAEGVVGRRVDGRFGFVRIDQTVELHTEAGMRTPRAPWSRGQRTAAWCQPSLDLPVETTIEVRAPVAAGQP